MKRVVFQGHIWSKKVNNFIAYTAETAKSDIYTAKIKDEPARG